MTISQTQSDRPCADRFLGLHRHRNRLPPLDLDSVSGRVSGRNGGFLDHACPAEGTRPRGSALVTMQVGEIMGAIKHIACLALLGVVWV
jgi:hypothetical protein